MAKVSVIIPVYNSEKYIVNDIESVLNQTYSDFEIILVNDCSTDRSVELIQRINDKRIKLYHNLKNRGIAYTRNRAFELATGEYVAFFDDDDIMPPYRLEREVQYLDERLDIDLVGGHMRYIDTDGKVLNKYTLPCFNPKYIKAYLMLGNAMANGTVMVRKKFVCSNNITWKDDMQGTEDYLFFVDCSLHGKITNMNEIFLYWRTGHGQETTLSREEKKDKRKKSLDYIHTYALEKNGFILCENELKTINKVFYEDGSIENEEELNSLFIILKKITKQAEVNCLDNAKEIKEMCRKRFGEKVGKAFYLWE